MILPFSFLVLSTAQVALDSLGSASPRLRIGSTTKNRRRRNAGPTNPPKKRERCPPPTKEDQNDEHDEPAPNDEPTKTTTKKEKRETRNAKRETRNAKEDVERPFDATQFKGSRQKCDNGGLTHTERVTDVRSKDGKLGLREEDDNCGDLDEHALPPWYKAKLDSQKNRRNLIANGYVSGWLSSTLEKYCKQVGEEYCRGPEGSGEFHSYYPDRSYVDSSRWSADKFTKFQVAIFNSSEPFGADWKCKDKICEKPQHANCGGTIIDKSTVITAAHCISRKSKETKPTIWVVAGQNEMRSKSKWQQISTVKEIFIPDGFQFTSRGAYVLSPKSDDEPTNDFAVLKLTSPLTFSKAVGRACLPKKDSTLDNDITCFVSGWGNANNKDVHDSAKTHRPLKLRFVEVRTASLDVCDGRCDNICTGEKDADVCTGGKGACHADSGGPLICKGEKGEAVVVGTVQGGKECGGPNLYSAVEPRLDMIRSKMEPLDNNGAEQKRRRAKTIQFSNSMSLGTIFALGGI